MVAGAIGLLLCGKVSNSATVTNLAINGGFEAVTDKLPDDWTHHKGMGGSVTLVTVPGRVHGGKQAVMLKPKPEPPNSSTVLYSNRIRIEPGKRYRATAWAKGKGSFQISFYEYSPKKAWVGGAGLGAVRVTDAWQPYVLHYGNPPEKVGLVAVVVQAHGADSEVIVDDVVLEVVDLPGAPEGPENGAISAAGPGRGAADGWEGPAERLRTQEDDKGNLCQRFDARMLASDVRGDLKQEDYFNYRVASAVQPPAWASFNCTEFPVEPGTTYELRFRLQAADIHTFHIKLRFFDLAGQPYAVGSGVRPYTTLGGTRDGTWEYQCFECRATSPVTAGKARIEFWCRCGGGTLWVDDLTVRSVVAPPVHPSHIAPHWREDGGRLPSASVPERRAKKVRAAGRPPAKSEVMETAHSLSVRLPNGVRLQVLRDGERILGIGEVSIGNVHLRNPHAPLMAPLVETTDGGEYVACHYRGHALGSFDEVILRTELRGDDGRADKLDWHIAQHQVQVGDLAYRGLTIWYVFSSAEHGVLQIVDRATWELGGSAVGLTVVDQNSYAGRNVFLLTEDSPYCTGSGARFVAGECLDYQCAPEGALFAYFENPCFVRYQRMGTPEFVIFRDAHQFAGTKTAETTRKFILHAERGDRDLWAQARDFAYRHARGRAGIVRDTPLPLANVWTNWQELAKIGKDKYYRKIIDEYLPTIADCGFKRILVHEPWEHGGCSPSDLAINSAFGGETTLKALCDAARSHDMQIIAWYGPGHLWGRTPLFEKHPEFRLRGRDGKPPTTYCWPDIAGVDLTGPWFDYAIDKLKGIRERTGLGGFWLDSYTNFTHNVKCANRELEIRQAESLTRFHAAIQALGYVTYTEASSNFGIKANGLPVGGLDSPTPSWPAPDELYDTSPYVGGWKEEYEIRLAEGFVRDGWYFRALANKCVPFVYWRRFRDRPEWQQKLRPANRVYNAVVPYMHRRRLLADQAGVLWTSADGETQVVFAFRSHDLELPGRHQALLAPDLESVRPITAGRLRLEPGKTYLVR